MTMSHKKFTKFSERVGIEKQAKEFDFFDILFRKDSKFFVDPVLIKAAAEREGEYQHLFIRMKKNIDTFFEEVLKELKKTSLRESLFKHSGETQATFLGYSSEATPGKGNSPKILMDAFRYVQSQELVKLKIITHLEQMTLYTHAFSYDRMSDLIISLIRLELAEFSLMQSKKYGFEEVHVSKEERVIGHRWDADARKWIKFSSRVINPDAVQVLLIPNEIVTRKMVYDPQKFLSSVLYRKQQEYKAAGVMTTEKSNGEVVGPSYKQIKEVEIKDQGLKVKEYLINEYSPSDLKSFKSDVMHRISKSSSGLSSEEVDAYRKKDFKQA